MNDTLIAGGLFVLSYAIIVSERIDRTVAALLGGIAMILTGVISQHQAFLSIDWNVIFLLAGMMIIANILREVGLFQWIAVKAVKLGKGRPYPILIILVSITAIASALLDNVTIVILVAPITLFVATSLRINPVPFLIAEILASNIGGAATLIGDPPNILIGSAANIDFLTFALNMVPVIFIILLVYIPLCWFLFRKDLHVAGKKSVDIDALDTTELISDKKLLAKGIVVLLGVLLGFLLHGALHLEPATIALAGAVVLLVWGGSDVHNALREIEWPTLFFFIGLFILVEGIVYVGIIEKASEILLKITGEQLSYTSILILWMSSIASGIIDNIPYTATMIPIVENLGQSMPIMPLWWSLALGACLGGNTTLIGASANVVVANIATRSGHPIGFLEFIRYGLITSIISLVIASFYIWIRYL